MKKILVIEDSPEVREIIGETLRLKGFEVFTAADGLSGIDLARSHLPDLIICDIRMPNMDGYDTLAALREDAATAVIPFIFLTGAADRTHVRRGMELGADDYLTKPFTADELMAAVSARLEKHEEIHRQSERKLDELRGNLTMALPHELRTPLNGILGLSSLLVEEGETMGRPQILETARYINDSALRLHRLIENFLVYSQIELLSTDPNRGSVLRPDTGLPVGELLISLAQQNAQQAQREKDLVLRIEPADVPITEEHLKKIVEELVGNAFKFSEPGTPVVVATSQEGGQFVLMITDRGRGMTPEQIANVGAHMQFERKFYEQQGAGLGLIIAKRLTELLGGQFRIESTPGQQTTVRVAFSLRPASG
jgi:two-component system sensor histidine kinase/response regulator